MIPQIPEASVAPLHPSEEVFRMHQRGQISTHDYHIQVSLLVSDDSANYEPTPYLPMMPAVREYVDGRMNGVRDYTGPLAAKLGDWVFGVTRAYQANLHALEMLIWAKENLEPAGLKDAMKKLDAMADRLRRVNPPLEELKRAMRVKELDARARRQGVNA